MPDETWSVLDNTLFGDGGDVRNRVAVTAADADRSEPSWLSAIEAASAGGVLGGFLYGAVAYLAVADPFSPYFLWRLVPVMAAGGAVIGLMLMLIPGAIVAMMVQRSDSVRSAPMIGAVFGSIVGIGVAAFVDTFTGGYSAIGFTRPEYLGFALCGLIGGVLGGRVLRHSVASL